jgi:hypothetical protein
MAIKEKTQRQKATIKERALSDFKGLLLGREFSSTLIKVKV